LKGGRRRRRQQERAALSAAGAGDGGRVSDKQVSIKYQQVSGFILFIFIAVFSRYRIGSVSPYRISIAIPVRQMRKVSV
jgi:hypothetical protein